MIGEELSQGVVNVGVRLWDRWRENCVWGLGLGDGGVGSERHQTGKGQWIEEE